VQKIAHHCQVENEQVVAVRDMPSIYQVPILLEEQGLVPVLRNLLDLDSFEPHPTMIQRGADIWSQWKDRTAANQDSLKTVTIALVGKYVELHDAYMSVIKALEHCAMRCKRQMNLVWVDAEHLEPQYEQQDSSKYHQAWNDVKNSSGILVPGGFGHRGTEGMIAAAKYARETKTPYLGICLGMQIAVIEFARNVCGLGDATSEEFESATSKDHVIMYMPEVDRKTMGATMRLGLRPTLFQNGSEWSKLRALYGDKNTILERHRHRYEVNPDYINRLEENGLCFIGKDDMGKRMEIIESKDHPFFVGVQFHPEYLSRVLDPSKPYLGFIAASAGCLSEITQELQAEAQHTSNGVH
jgi:CTP synthase